LEHIRDRAPFRDLILRAKSGPLRFRACGFPVLSDRGELIGYRGAAIALQVEAAPAETPGGAIH
jgi:hypothetical protein